uniref:Uncharacterized protein n=2 Tax=Oryza sativa subsp. japonica TaxID=39947 RepID=Q852D4_ORYSJ|nr:hypothetical protein [Oryza sativa Japonica Group]ABF99903.1 hypothetical protein LOC_Os03g63190 [Oryza sativa Japonica Group]
MVPAIQPQQWRERSEGRQRKGCEVPPIRPGSRDDDNLERWLRGGGVTGEGGWGTGGLGRDGCRRWRGRLYDGGEGATNPEVGAASMDGGVEGGDSGIGLLFEAAVGRTRWWQGKWGAVAAVKEGGAGGMMREGQGEERDIAGAGGGGRREFGCRGRGRSDGGGSEESRDGCFGLRGRRMPLE